MKAGVLVIAGSDATEREPDPTSEVEYGISLLRELQNQHEAGMSNNDIGILETGRRADILLLDDNQIEKISGIYKINSVWLEGVFVFVPFIVGVICGNLAPNFDKIVGPAVATVMLVLGCCFGAALNLVTAL